MTTTKLESSIQHGYSVDIGAYLRQGFALFQKKPGLFLAFALVSGLITTASQIVPFIGFIAAILVSYPLTAGYYLVARELEQGNEVTFSTFFRGFDFFGNLVAINLIQVVAAMVLFLPFGISMGLGLFFSGLADSDWGLAAVSSMSLFWLFVMLIPMLYLYVSWMFAPLFVVFHGMGFWDAMETSRKLVQKRWWIFFAFTLVLALVMLGGILALLIGLLVAIPIVALSTYAAFGHIAGFMDDYEEGDTITDHLVE